MTRVTVPQDYVVTEGTVIDDFSNYASFNKQGTSAWISQDTTNVKHGTSSVRITSSGVNSNAYVTKDTTFSLAGCDGLWLSLYAEPSSIVLGFTLGITLYLSNLTGLSNDRWSYTGVGNDVAVRPGWNMIPIYNADWGVLSGSPSFANNIKSYRVRIDAGTSRYIDVTFDALIVTRRSRPKILVSLDDSTATGYSIGFVEANARDIRLTHYVIPENIGGGGSSSLSEIQAMYAAGDDIGLHDANRWDTVVGGEAGLSARLAYLRGYVEANIGNRASMHGSWPEGQYGADTGNATDTTANLRVAAESQLLTCRGTQGRSSLSETFADNPMYLNSAPLNSSTTLAAAKSAVDKAITHGGVLGFYGHNFAGSAGSTTWATSDWTDFLNYLVLKRSQGFIDCVTISEWYSGLTNQRQVDPGTRIAAPSRVAATRVAV